MGIFLPVNNDLFFKRDLPPLNYLLLLILRYCYKRSEIFTHSSV